MNAGGRDPGDAEARVSRLLAEAGSDPVQMPPAVSARLHDVLADLQRERVSGSTAATSDEVVELRARRRWPRLLLAAAAVVVSGYTVTTVLTQGTLSGSGEAMTAGSDSLADDSGGGRALRDNDLDTGAAEERGDQKEAAPTESEAAADGAAPLSGDFLRLDRPVVLRSDELDTGVRRALRVLDRELPATSALRSGASEFDAQSGCAPPDLSKRQRSLTVRYDGVRGVLVAGPPREGLVRVIVYDCSGTQLDSTRVPR